MRQDLRSGARPERHGLSLTEQAYAVLRERVMTGEMRPGTELSEPELAAEFAMSKTPVREALARLCAEGLMEAYPRRGYRVTPVTLKDLDDLFAVRGAIEALAAALAAEHMTAEELDALAALAGGAAESGGRPGAALDEREGVRGIVAANRRFHAAIAEGARNSRLATLVVGHLEQCSRLFFIGARIRDVTDETGEDHARLVRAIRSRDAAAASAAMLAHNDHTRRGLLSALTADGMFL